MASMLESLCSVDVYRILHLAAIFCLSVMLLKGIQLYQRRKALLTALQHFPGPPSHWLYGQAHEFYKDGFDLDTLHHWGLQYPNANPVWFGSFLAYLNITYVEYAKDLLSRTDPIDSLAYKYFIPWFDEGLLLSSKQKWFQHRQLQTIGFHYDVLKLQVKQMVDCTNVMLDQLKEEGEESMDIYPYVSMMALDNILKFVFSYDTNCQKDSDSPFIMAVSELTSLVYDRLLWLPYYTDIIFYLSPKGDHFRRVCKISQQHTDNVIKQRKESVKNKEQRENTLQSRPVDLLDMLLEVQDENGHGLSDEDLCAEVNTFIVTGQDMAASGISWILYCMAKYPEHQKKCQEEIRRVLGNRQTLEWDDLHQIPYTTMCIYESLRLYPPVPLLPRKLNKPITFCDGRSLPEGTLVAVNIYSIHRNPDVWEDPEVFDPLRFSPENTELRHSHAYLPFAAGSRNCIGHNVAMIEMKVTVALTLNRFELSPDTTLTPIKRSLMTLKSKNGIHLRLRSTRGRKKDVQE